MIDTGLPVSLFFRLVRGVCILLSLSLLHVNIGDCILLCYFHDKTQFYIKFNLFYFINGLQFHINTKDLDNEDLAFLYHIEACTSVGDLSLPLVQEFQKHMLKTFFNGH